MGENELKLTGIWSQGYGNIPKLVMRDTNLSIEAKGLYAYLRSFSGAGNTAFPSVELICHDLQISEKRFRKGKDALIESGYITVKRERVPNGFSKNIYELTDFPVSGQIVPVQNDRITENVYTEDFPVPSQFVSGRIVPVQIVSVQNDRTNNNNLTNNNLNKNNLNNNSRRNRDVAATASHDLSEIFNFWEQNGFGMLAPKTRQDLEFWVNDFQEIGATEKDAGAIVLRALEISVDNNVKKYNYANSILKSWEQKRMLTVQQIEAEDKRPGKEDNKDANSWEQDWSIPEQNKVELKMTDEEYRQFEDELPF